TSTKRSFSIKKTTTDKGVACGERPGKANVTNQAWYVMKRTRWGLAGTSWIISSGPCQVTWSPLL
ncbi:MAG TPA: hypothetical protein PK528_14250, partial [Syntrophorhabdus sp.]|nr:hypothetical protein [Syntrophorhabdus sp.]